MATVNKKFNVKNGLGVDGNVAVSNATSFTVDGPSADSLTFALTNVTAATINGSPIATQGWVSSQSYLTSETDPVFTASDAYGITSTDISNWDTAYGWGNHASAGYLTTESDPVFTASDVYGVTTSDISNWDTAYGWGNHASAGYLTTESDPVFTASDVYGVTTSDISNWDTAYGWGNHASAGYLTTESDPVFVASDVYGVTSTDISNWDTAYGWGNHASAGYLTSAVESISNTDGNITFSAASGTVTADLATDVEIAGDLVVQGDLTVNGDVTTINTATLAVEDNLVVLNTNVTGTPTLDAGIEVERGDYTNAKLFWKESANAWYLGTPGDSSDAATEAQIATVGNVLTLEDAAVISAHASATSGAPSVYAWDSAVYSTAKFTIQMKQGSDIHVLELLATVAGSNVYVTEYAEIISNVALGETDVTLSAGTATLTVTPVTGTVVTKIAATLIEA